MLKIIKERSTHTEVEYYIEFTDKEGAGFSFPCDSNGNIQFSDNPELSRAQRDNYDYAMSNKERFIRQYAEFVTRKYTVTDNAVGKCVCGEEVELYDQYQGACSCPKCGQWYNVFGQELIDPEYWDNDVSESEPW
jgi:hypothetical protein